jgi:translation initiation factor eIF-2B subunit delta
LIKDFTTPAEKAFSRALETEIQSSVEFLHKCRPLAVSVSNALKYIKLLISQENSQDSDDEVSFNYNFYIS